jgi:hypothetical protein
VHYASDLSFVHLPTLVGPYISAVQHDRDDGEEDCFLDTTQATPLGSSGLVLAFLALTLRHCRHKVREYLVPRAYDLDNSAALSAYFAVLAKRCLTSNDADWSRSDVEGVQVRLMLATYDWSLGRSQQARQLLSEAISLAGDFGLLQDYRAKHHGSSSISVAMAFEAESMGIRMRLTVGHNDLPDHDVQAEAARRTTWSLFLLDTEYALGDHRSKLISNTDSFPSLPSNEAAFAGNLLMTTLPGDEQLTAWQRHQVPEPIDVHLQSEMYYYAPASTACWPGLEPSISSTSSNSLPDSAVDQSLSYYIRYVSLFYRIHAWAHSKPWRFVCHDTRVDPC